VSNNDVGRSSTGESNTVVGVVPFFWWVVDVCHGVISNIKEFGVGELLHWDII